MRLMALGLMLISSGAGTVNAYAFPLPSAAAAKLILTPTTTLSRCLSHSLTKVTALGSHRADVPHTRRLELMGGLLPSATIAAQTGAIDPVRQAEATARGTTAADRWQTVDVRVASGDGSTLPRPWRCP